MARTGAGHKGYFITFEGPEGSGKSTHARLLYLYLKNKGCDCVFTREPGGTPVGDKIRKILLQDKNIQMKDVCELFLFEASRTQVIEEVILPALTKGKIVICDRFSDATVAYQGFGAGLDIPLIKKLNNLCTRGIKPDKTVLLDVETKIGLKRAKVKKAHDRIERKKIAFHRRVRRGYLKLAKQQPRRIKVVKSDKSINVIQGSIRKLVLRCLSKI